ncbi:hypothetical protein SEA_FIZZLES_63 [Microbacterium phage Fizzles]|nr:hypothetical protein SEA_FIZZLES_63 [Microbacterium phage Fizzles]
MTAEGAGAVSDRLASNRRAVRSEYGGAQSPTQEERDRGRTLADEARQAALQQFPDGITAEGEREWRRVPFAHGYQVGFAAALANARVEIQSSRLDGSLKMERYVDGRWVAWDGIAVPGERYTVRTVRTRP